MTPPPDQGPQQTLTVESVTKHFAGVSALEDVNLTVLPGEIHALIGPNGAGKSTLFNVISGIYRPDRGRVSLGSTDLTTMPTHRMASLGIARTFQNLAASATETVEDSLLLGRHRFLTTGVSRAILRSPQWRREEDASRQVVREVAAFVGLSRELKQTVQSLPYGQRKRLELGRALCLAPDLLLLDEPAAGLNSAETLGMAEAIKSVRAVLGTSILLIEHDMSLVLGIADQVTVLDFGRLIATGSPSDIAADPKVIAAYLGAQPEPEQPISTGSRERENSTAPNLHWEGDL